MIKLVNVTLLLLALIFITSGCGGESSLSGAWEIDKAAMKKALMGAEKIDKEAADNPVVKGVADMIDQMSMVMVLNDDGTCTSTASMMGKTDSTSGTWKLEGDVLSVTMKVMMEEKPKDDTQEFKVQGDKLVVILDEEEEKSGYPAFIFKRQ